MPRLKIANNSIETNDEPVWLWLEQEGKDIKLRCKKMPDLLGWDLLIFKEDGSIESCNSLTNKLGFHLKEKGHLDIKEI